MSPTPTPQYVWVTHGNTEQFAILKEPLEGKSKHDEVLIHWVTTDNDDYVPVSSVKLELDSRRSAGRRRGKRGVCDRTTTTTTTGGGGSGGGGGGLNSPDQGQGQGQERQGRAAPSAGCDCGCQKHGEEETEKRVTTFLLGTSENQQQQQHKKTKNNKKRRVSVVVDVEYAAVTSNSMLEGETIKNEGPATTAVCEEIKVEKQEEYVCTTAANVPAVKATRTAETARDAASTGKAAVATEPKSEATDRDTESSSTIAPGPEDSHSSPRSQLLLPPSSLSSSSSSLSSPSSSSSLKSVHEHQCKHEHRQEQTRPHEETHGRGQPQQLDIDDNGFNVHVRRVKTVSNKRDHDDLKQDEDFRLDDSSSTTAMTATSPLLLSPFKTGRLSSPLVDEQQMTKTYFPVVPSNKQKQEKSSVCASLSDSNSKAISLSTYPKEMKLIRKFKEACDPNFGANDSLTRNTNVKERPRFLWAPGPESSLPSSSNDIGAQPNSFGKKFNRKPVDRGGAFNTLDISPTSHHSTATEQDCSASVNRQNWYKMLALFNQRNAHGGQ